MRFFNCCYPCCEHEATHHFQPQPPFASLNPDGRLFVCFRHVSAYILCGVCAPAQYHRIPDNKLWFLRNSGRIGEWLDTDVNQLEPLVERYKREDEGVPENWKP